MKEKILALLTEKFAGVRKDGLNQLAGALAMQVDTEQDAAAVVGKFTADGVAKFIAEWRKEADAEITKANKTHEDGLRKKYEFAEKKTEPATPPAPAAEGNLDAAAIQKMMTDAIAAATKPLLEKVAAMETGNVAKSRLEKLTEKLTGCKSEIFKTKTLKDFARMQFDSDDAFSEYIADTEKDVTAANQSVVETAFGMQQKPWASNTPTGKEATEAELKAVLDKMAF